MNFTITAEILPGKVDENATAQFVNLDRAEQYGVMLRDSGDYMVVALTDIATGERGTF